MRNEEEFSGQKNFGGQRNYHEERPNIRKKMLAYLKN